MRRLAGSAVQHLPYSQNVFLRAHPCFPHAHIPFQSTRSPLCLLHNLTLSCFVPIFFYSLVHVGKCTKPLPTRPHYVHILIPPSPCSEQSQAFVGVQGGCTPQGKSNQRTFLCRHLLGLQRLYMAHKTLPWQWHILFTHLQHGIVHIHEGDKCRLTKRQKAPVAAFPMPLGLRYNLQATIEN